MYTYKNTYKFNTCMYMTCLCYMYLYNVILIHVHFMTSNNLTGLCGELHVHIYTNYLSNVCKYYMYMLYTQLIKTQLLSSKN